MMVEVRMPKPGNAVESCLLLAWKKEVGEAVRAGEVLCEIETDKAVMEVESPADGVLLQRLAEAGQEVPVQTPIAIVGKPGAGAPTHPLPPASDRRKPGISPRARRLAPQEILESVSIGGSGPGGRIIERDVCKALEHSPPSASGPGFASLAPPEPWQAVPLQGVRKRVAERMLHSLQQSAQLTLQAYVEVEGLLKLRAELKHHSDPRFREVNLNHLLLYALARTLPQFPELNACLVGDTLYQYRAVHLGFAVDTPRGLLVPVLQHAERLGLLELAQKVRQLSEEARQGKAAPQALQGGTFSVSNLGSLGIEVFTPILNSPQVAILGVGAVGLRPVQDGPEVVFRPHLPLSLTFDHRATDGAPAARFLQALGQRLTDPLCLLAL
ncbi:dihydrolipoamide acetyltransferase family protein [Meiothermus sp.]|uniref:dihydrolipoamide acetyltransferase family protein n=1 Tax=Meiothermus sp. TaxID=1955249 RepID=UPI0021DE4981|nr:dihydrolipoamide acetyltransferase family protein [Meiothermus sp.]GIW35595.1 MAG: dihydrolipoyllysine-residue acetyltransferase component of acetoin cleaving system [Meiothermus sp.]